MPFPGRLRLRWYCCPRLLVLIAVHMGDADLPYLLLQLQVGAEILLHSGHVCRTESRLQQDV